MLHFYVYRAPKRPRPTKVQYPAVFLFDDGWDDYGYKSETPLGGWLRALLVHRLACQLLVHRRFRSRRLAGLEARASAF
jgi:hypothetical protein